MNKIKKIVSIITAFSICLLLCSCSKKDKGPESSIIYYDISSEPETIDPQIAKGSTAELIIMNIYEGLVRLDENDDISEGAAEKWEISSDKMSYTFHLRKNLKWCDGTPLKAGDFVYGIQRAVSKQTISPTANTLYCIKNAEKINKGQQNVNTLGVTAPDDNTVKIELEYPDSNLMYLLTTPPAMPCSKRFFEGSVGQYGRTAEKILSNGAFMIGENDWSDGEYIFLTKNKNYNGKDKPVPMGINFSVKEISDVYQAISEKEIDCGAIDNKDVKKAEKAGMNLESYPDSVWGITFNTEDDVLKSKDMRSCLLSVIDREKALKQLPENCIETSCIIPETAELENTSYRKNAGKIEYEPIDDPEKIMSETLEKLGIKNVPDFTILCLNDEELQPLVNELIVKWNSITGAYFNKKPVSESELNEKLRNGTFQIAIAPLKITGITPLDTLEQFVSSSEYNISLLKSEEFDSMISDIRKNLTLSSKDMIKDAESYIMSESLFYPLYTRSKFYASAKNVTNIIFHPYSGNMDFFYTTKVNE